uniref:Uncharacterized protein n=1 Tax=Anguilla anguilla TaxID=7936 RepID=A0A0E9W9B0_ANGAN
MLCAVIKNMFSARNMTTLQCGIVFILFGSNVFFGLLQLNILYSWIFFTV